MLKITRTLVALAALAVPLLAEAPDQVESALLAKYKLSTVAPNHRAVAKVGSVLVLGKGNLLMWEVATLGGYGNSYKKGHIGQAKLVEWTQAQNPMAGSRMFQQGDRVLVTGIEVKPKGVIFEIYTIADNTCYKGKLDFPLDKKSEPSLSEVMQEVGEVFQIQSAAGPAYLTQVQAPPDPNPTPAPAPVAEAPAPLPQIPSLAQSIVPEQQNPQPQPGTGPNPVKIGQTMAQVKSNWGAPLKTRVEAGKQIWVYQRVELVFVNSKLSDIR